MTDVSLLNEENNSLGLCSWKNEVRGGINTINMFETVGIVVIILNEKLHYTLIMSYSVFVIHIYDLLMVFIWLLNIIQISKNGIYCRFKS
jgi:hypothetical protein